MSTSLLVNKVHQNPFSDPEDKQHCMACIHTAKTLSPPKQGSTVRTTHSKSSRLSKTEPKLSGKMMPVVEQNYIE